MRRADSSSPAAYAGLLVAGYGRGSLYMRHLQRRSSVSEYELSWKNIGVPLPLLAGASHSLDPVGLFKKAMLSTVAAFCKRPWYLSNSPKRRNKRKSIAGIEPKTLA
jgi:hypothetical protein